MSGSRSFAGHVLLEELARGGSGVVWRAQDPRGREVALKLAGGPGLTPARRERWNREARALLRLSHPDLVRALDMGESQGTLWLALELLPGESLQGRLDRQGPLPLAEAVAITRRLALALAHAHAVGVLHRDVKPDNVVLRATGEPVLTDFGLALESDEAARLTATGQPLGTPGYWAPELAQGQNDRLSAATDVYGLGASLVALLTGDPPHGPVTNILLALEQIGKPPPPPSRRRPEVDPALDAICLRALAPDPAARHSDARAFAADLARWERSRTAGGGTRLAPLAAGALVLCGLAVAAALLAQPGPGPGPPPPPPPGPRPEPVPDPPTTDLARFGLPDLPPGGLEALDQALARRDGGDARGALALLDAALARWPDEPSFLAERGMARSAVGEYAAALEDFDRALAVAPRAPLLHYDRGISRRDAGDLRGADRDFSRALELEPGFHEGWSARGQLRRSLGDLSGALADLTRCLELHPDEWGAHEIVGVLLRDRGEAAAALTHFEACLRIAPGRAHGHLNRGVARADLGDHPAALTDYARALELDPRLAAAANGQGTSWFKLGELEKAQDAYRRALALDPKLGVAWFNLSTIAEQRGDLTEAVAAARRALELSPTGPIAEQSRARLTRLEGRR